jgi:hypothetical protein
VGAFCLVERQCRRELLVSLRNPLASYLSDGVLGGEVVAQPHSVVVAQPHGEPFAWRSPLIGASRFGDSHFDVISLGLPVSRVQEVSRRRL